MVEESSSRGGSSSTFAADGDLTTVWEASTNANELVTLDLGDVREVTALRLQVGTEAPLYLGALGQECR